MSTSSDVTTESPLTSDQLLEYENTRASEPMPEHLLETMSERRVHVSTAGSNRIDLNDLGKELSTTSSFRLPANAFLGQLGGDGQSKLSVPPMTPPADVIAQPVQPAWQDRIYHPKLAPMPPNPAVKGRDAAHLRADNVYLPENRTPFRPEGYPWTCIGRIEVFENGRLTSIGSAALVGRRLAVTSGHLMPRDGSPGKWGIRFVPGYFDGNSTVGIQSWTEAYRAFTITVSDSTQDRDLSFMKLYDPIGDALGSFGAKTYNDDWEDKGMWTLVGYPGSITSAQRPTLQKGIAVIDDDPSGDFAEIEHRGDADDGNSGGPLWAEFPDGPYIIGVHSGGEYREIVWVVDENNNVAAGGVALVNMINSLRAEWP
jgi:hypothetical protein